MEHYIFDWLNLLLRWLHIIVGIAWIGASFYFVWLDNSLVKPTDPEVKNRGVDGELWAVHGGGFYNPQKYMVAPKNMPEHLHWFYWESYWTWMSGFALFVVLYLFNASTYLVDKNVYDWSAAAAITASLVYLVMGWVVYDGICRFFGQGKNGDLIVGILVFIYVVLASYIACALFAGRAAFLLTGAMLATAMSANVLMVIIPGQKKTVAALKAGQTPDPIHPKRAKQRSVHNTYFTLPVLFAMLSNHYSFAYGAKYNWLVLVLIMLAGALIRQFFVLKHKGRWDYKYWIIAAVLLLGVAFALAPAPSAPVAKGAPPVKLAEVQHILEQRCQMCHNEAVAMKGIHLNTPEEILKNAQNIYQQAVVTKQMPMANSTQMTDEERATIARWIKEGAKGE